MRGDVPGNGYRPDRWSVRPDAPTPFTPDRKHRRMPVSYPIGRRRFIASAGGLVAGLFAGPALIGPDGTAWAVPRPGAAAALPGDLFTLGVAAGDLPTVFPNIGRFASPDLGFMTPPARAVRGA